MRLLFSKLTIQYLTVRICNIKTVHSKIKFIGIHAGNNTCLNRDGNHVYLLINIRYIIIIVVKVHNISLL